MTNGEGQQTLIEIPAQAKEEISLSRLVKSLLQKFPRPDPPRWRVYVLGLCLGLSIGALVWSGLTEKKVKKMETVISKREEITSELQLFLKRALVAVQRVEAQNQQLREEVERLNVVVLVLDQRTEKLDLFIRNVLLERRWH